MNTAVFLDRDGVITAEPPYFAHKPDQFKVLPNSLDAIKLLNENNFKVILVSNQSGIGRHYYTVQDMQVFNNLLTSSLNQINAHIDKIYFCPHHPDEGCECRKPKPGMLLLAEKELNIDLKHSYVVGDRLVDIQAGKSAGCTTILVRTGHGGHEIQSYPDINPHIIVDNIYDAALYIIENCKKLNQAGRTNQ